MQPERSLPHSQMPATCPYPESGQSIQRPYPTSWRSILILSSHLRQGLPSCLFPSGFATKFLYTPLFPLRATCHTHLLLELINRISGEEYRSIDSPFRNILHSPVTLSPLGPNILLSTLFPNNLSPRSSLSTSDQVSHPYKTTGKIIVLYVIIFIFSYRKLAGKKDSAPNDSEHCLTSICS